MSQLRRAVLGDASHDGTSLRDTWRRRRQRLGLLIATAVAIVLVSQAFALHDQTSAQEVTCPGGATPQADYGGELVCPDTGTITGGEVPAQGLALVVFGGGTSSQLVAASGCPATARFWSIVDTEFIVYIPASAVARVNAAWLSLYGGGIPANTALIATCGRAALASAAPVPEAVPSAVAAGRILEQPGETLLGIATREGADWRDLPQVRSIVEPEYAIYAG